MTSTTHQPADSVIPPASAAAEPAPRPLRRMLILGAAAVAIIGFAIWAIPLYLYGRSHESTDNAQVDGHIIPVLARVGGFVTRVNVSENQHVTEGTVLIQLDSAEYAERVAQATAELAAAQASAGGRGQTGQAQAAVQTATNQQAATQSQIAAARADEARALADLRRFETLAARQIASQQQLETTRAAALAATANREALEQQTAAAGATVSSARAGVRLAEARLAVQRAALETAQLQLSYTTIRAPASGIVSRRQVEVGQLSQAGQPLLSIVADTGVYVTANLKETQLERVRQGQAVDIDVDAYDCRASGRVESISGATGAKFSLIPPENATGNFTKVVQRIPVRIAIVQGCGREQPLRPGMSVEAHIRTK